MARSKIATSVPLCYSHYTASQAEDECPNHSGVYKPRGMPVLIVGTTRLQRRENGTVVVGTSPLSLRLLH